MKFNYLVDVNPSKREITDEGFLIARESVLAGVGIQKYYAKELGLSDRDPLAVVNVMRTADDVLAPKSVKTFDGKPVTLGHPKDKVTAKNYKALTTGSMTNIVANDELQSIVGDVTIADIDAIKSIEDGTSCLSVGYDCEIVPHDGIYNGQSYEFVQKNIRANHLAIVPKGRFSQARLSDEDNLINQKGATMPNKNEPATEPVAATPQQAPAVHQLTDEQLQKLVNDKAKAIADVAIADALKLNETINKAKLLVKDYSPAAEADRKAVMLSSMNAAAGNTKVKQILDAMFNNQPLENLNDWALEIGFDFMCNITRNLPAMLNDAAVAEPVTTATNPVVLATTVGDSQPAQYVDSYQTYRDSFSKGNK